MYSDANTFIAMFFKYLYGFLPFVVAGMLFLFDLDL